MLKCGELLHSVYSPAVFPTSKRRDKRRVLQGGKLSLVILWKSYLVNSELYLAIAVAFRERERESCECSFPPLSCEEGGGRPNIVFLDSAHPFSSGVLPMSSPRMVLG
jgi:hypothetical protein